MEKCTWTPYDEAQGSAFISKKMLHTVVPSIRDDILDTIPSGKSWRKLGSDAIHSIICRYLDSKYSDSPAPAHPVCRYCQSKLHVERNCPVP